MGSISKQLKNIDFADVCDALRSAMPEYGDGYDDDRVFESATKILGVPANFYIDVCCASNSGENCDGDNVVQIGIQCVVGAELEDLGIFVREYTDFYDEVNLEDACSLVKRMLSRVRDRMASPENRAIRESIAIDRNVSASGPAPQTARRL